MGVRRNSAVYAGLIGTIALGAPLPAVALSAREVVDAFDAAFASPSLAFAVGLAGGALITGAIAGTAALVARRRRARVEETPLESTATDLPVVEAPALIPLEHPANDLSTPAPKAPRHMRAEAPVPEQAPVEAPAAVEPQHHGPSHAATDYEDIAENYVGRMTFRSRMARRAEGVAATLRDRLGANMMDGVPVIERADGSVGDVGTSWWKQAVGEQSIISDAGFAADDFELAIPSDFTDPGARLFGSAPLPVLVPNSSGDISMRVAQIDEGAYPERRTVEDLDREDEWDLALRSLDERIAADAAAQPPAPFVDLVGGEDSLDEPDNLELQTSFIPFRTPAGHPEVVDTESYVDYLIEDELSRNSSKAVRRHSRRFLRVLEGGTQSSPRLSDTSSSRPIYIPKHFAMPQAAEA